MPRRRRLRSTPFARAVLALLALFAMSACSRAPQLYVIVDSDITPDQVNDFRIRCAYNWDGTSEMTGIECDQSLLNRVDGSSAWGVPASFGVRLDRARPGGSFTLVIDDREVGRFRRVIRASVPNNERRQLAIYLNSACLRPACGCRDASHPCTVSALCAEQGQTCGDDGTCRSIDVAPSELSPFGDGAVFRFRPDTGALDGAACTDGGSGNEGGPGDGSAMESGAGDGSSVTDGSRRD